MGELEQLKEKIGHLKEEIDTLEIWLSDGAYREQDFTVMKSHLMIVKLLECLKKIVDILG